MCAMLDASEYWDAMDPDTKRRALTGRFPATTWDQENLTRYRSFMSLKLMIPLMSGPCVQL
jgi:hypothetical protein